jgi:hypothetical protein
MSGIQCGCGRFLADAHAVIGIRFMDPYIHDVRGDCSRCGPDVPATHEGEAWWFDWDAWDIDEDKLFTSASSDSPEPLGSE